MRFHKLIPRDRVTFKNYEENEKLLKEIDEKARDNGQLLHRVIQESCADSYAIYQVIRVGKKNCRIEQVSVGADDWTIPYWGQEALVDRNYIEQKISWSDNIAKMFAEKRKEQNK